MARTSYVRESDAGWEVVRDGDRRASAVASTREEAVARARAIVRKQGGGEIRIMNRVGKLVEATKVARPTNGSASRSR